MKPKILYIQTHYYHGKQPKFLKELKKRKDIIIIWQSDLTSDSIKNATGIITTMHLDQLGMLSFSSELEAFLNRGGRWFFNGHMMRPLVFGLQNYIPIKESGKQGLALTPLADHPIFKGIDRSKFGESKGVAGFYGRGHNPMPRGATAITGIGTKKNPLDWDWSISNSGQKSGRIFSHAGNTLLSVAGDKEATKQLRENIFSWTLSKDNL